LTFPSNSKTELNAAPLLSLRGLHKSYDGKTYALSDVNLDVYAGEMVAVIGPSGAGKSTLIRCINHLVAPTSGAVLFNLAPFSIKMRPKIGMIFQHHNLIDRTPVLTNVLHGRLAHTPLHRSLFNAYTPEDRAYAHQLLAQVGLTAQAHRRASTLSGGQKQRAGICRALMQRPDLLLADEPIASLDPASADTVMDCLKNFAQQKNIACIINLHQVEYAKKYATRIIGMNGGEVVFNGSADELTDEAIAQIYGEGQGQRIRCKTVGALPRGSAPRFSLLCVLLLTFLSFRYINVNLFNVFAGFPAFVRFFRANFLPPNWVYIGTDSALIFSRVADTLFFAVVGTYISALAAFLLGLLMSREMNRLAPLRILVRFFVSFLRNVPLLVWATVMVFIFGIGAMVGIMALVFATLGFLARSYAESMDEIAATRLEALRAAGAGYWQVLFHGLVPSFIPAWVNWTLFSFEINIRASAVLGMVGAGGLGFLIQANLDLRGFRRAMALILILMAMVLATEFLMNFLRKKLAQPGSKAHGTWLRGAGIAGAAALFFFSAHRLDINLAQFIVRMQNAGAVLARFWAFNASALPEILRQLLVSAAIGVCALAIGCAISLVLAFLAAENIAPCKPLGAAIKGTVSLIRAIPSLVLILMVVASLGFGATAAVVGLVFSSVGYLTRAFIGSIEEQEYAAIHAMRATGAGRIQIILHGLLPAVFTSFVSWIAIRLEANIADSVSLGIVGAGGVGMLIARAVRQVDFAGLTTIILVVFAAMYLIEIGALWVRKKLTA